MLLYIHVPFCRRRCGYCAFHSQALPDGRVPELYLASLLEEIRSWSERLPEASCDPVESIFFGGGTPSLLEARQVGTVLEAIAGRFAVATDCECTLEGNPDSLARPGLLADLRACGISRLSMGVQSMDNRELAMLGRLHTASQCREVVAIARRAGFENLSLDLMWCLPGQTVQGWLATLAQACDLGPEHLSAYALSIEEGTPFDARRRAGELALPGEEDAEAMFLEGRALLEDRGYAQYEISNYARAGFRCRHNLGYWLGADYLGLGPSAVSTLNGRRWTDPPDLERWAQSIAAGRLAEDPEAIPPATRLLETVMLRLRTADGLPLAVYEALAGRSLPEDAGAFLRELCRQGLLVMDTERIALTPRGMLVSSAVTSELFLRLERAALARTPAADPPQ
ncbi:MAG: radical SAM family heme chaperone HemW [Desulfovibrio sp.]|nr:radical SAM family heme chaperone HemW [Desulfovibrio sp.]